MSFLGCADILEDLLGGSALSGAGLEARGAMIVVCEGVTSQRSCVVRRADVVQTHP